MILQYAYIYRDKWLVISQLLSIALYCDTASTVIELNLNKILILVQ